MGNANLEGRVDLTANDKVGHLAMAFSQITEGRQETERELRKDREHLQELVDKRNAELARASQILESEISERGQVEQALRYRAEFESLIATL